MHDLKRVKTNRGQKLHLVLIYFLFLKILRKVMLTWEQNGYGNGKDTKKILFQVNSNISNLD